MTTSFYQDSCCKLRPAILAIVCSVVLAATQAQHADGQTAVRFRDPSSNVNPLPAPAGPDGDWNIDNNWWDPFDNNFIPLYSAGGGENAYIENGGTAFVAGDGGVYPGGIFIGVAAGTSGRVEMRSGGVLNVQAGSSTSGGITVGGSGTGNLDVLSGGALTATGNITVANGSTVNIRPGGTLSTAAAVNFSASSNYEVQITGDNTSGSISAGTDANLNGNLHLNFNSPYNPSSSHSWTLLEANSINGSFSSITTSGALAFNEAVVLSKPDLGGGRVGLTAQIQEILVLEVNRDTGMVTMKHPGSASISFDGYYVGSDKGLLSAVDSDWQSLNESGQYGSDWIETAQTVNNIGELKIGADAAFGSDIPLGTIYKPLAGTFGTSGDDLEFQYRRSSDSAQIPGIVQYTGTKVNNLLLQVDPSGSGDTYLRNPSSTTVEIDGYEILSASSSLSTSGWTSLQESGSTANDWLEVGGVSATLLAEFDSEGFTTLAPGAAINLGSLFTGGMEDLEFNFLMKDSDEGLAGVVIYEAFTPSEGLPGDFNSDNVVNLADYTVWRDNLGAPSLPNDNGLGTVGASHYALWKAQFGESLPGALTNTQSVPEPATWLLMGALCALALARQTARSNSA